MAKATTPARKPPEPRPAGAPKAESKTAVRARRTRRAAATPEAPQPQSAQAPRHDASRIVVFCCQWAPHYAFQSLYRRGRRGEGDAVRVLTACIGRVGEDLVLEAFRQGADGVAILSCPPELCRHGLDHGRFRGRLAALRTILGTLGIPAEQLLVDSFHPHEAERLAEAIAAFAVRVADASAAEAVPAATRETTR